MSDSTAALMAAIKARDAAQVRELLAQDPSMAQVRGEDGTSALLTAAYYRAGEIVRLLLDAGAQPNLWEAVAAGLTDRVRVWLDARPELVNTYSPDGFTPLGLAAFFGHLEIARLLLDRGAEINGWGRPTVPYVPRNQALHAALAGSHPEVARLLVERGAEIDQFDSAGWTPLHHAAYGGDLDSAALLLARGADVNARREGAATPLGRALEKERHAVADLLRQHGGTE